MKEYSSLEEYYIVPHSNIPPLFKKKYIKLNQLKFYASSS